LVYWCVVCFQQQPQTDSPPPLYVPRLSSLGSMGFSPWLSGRAGG
jgi:hypothetical protein